MAAVALIVLGLGLWQSRSLGADLARPTSTRGSEYVGSSACRRCHQDNHDSWGRTFHRTMTQEASARSVVGDFAEARFVYGGITATMSNDDGRYWMRFSRHPDGPPDPDAWSAEVVRTVGSHRYQQYLARAGDTWSRLPVAWDIEAGRWMHMNGGFLTPDPPGLGAEAPIDRADYDRHVTRWNDNCVFCHNVDAAPGKHAAGFDTRVSELGIACEACHGPGSEHIALNTNPVRRYALHLSGEADPTIASPDRMTPERSSQICGQCHGQRLTKNIAEVLQHGDAYLPGEDLSKFSKPLARDTTLNSVPGTFAPRFWPDGTARLTAYEYQGLLQSACAMDGELSCGSCHTMHGGDPRGQLRTGPQDDAMCTDCHAELAGADAQRAHSHHAPDGAGGRCVSCHMPRVVYGIVRAHRSHRIDSPRPDLAPKDSRPDACTLCHLDRTRGWAATETKRLWPASAGAASAAAVAEFAETDVPEVMRLLLAGDPVEHAIAADALGHSLDARTAAPQRVGLLLDTMADDPYPAVRTIASRSLARLMRDAGHPAPPAFDATAGAAARARHAQRVATALPAAAIERPPAALTQRLRAKARAVAIEIGE